MPDGPCMPFPLPLSHRRRYWGAYEGDNVGNETEALFKTHLGDVELIDASGARGLHLLGHPALPPMPAFVCPALPKSLLAVGPLPATPGALPHSSPAPQPCPTPSTSNPLRPWRPTARSPGKRRRFAHSWAGVLHRTGLLAGGACLLPSLA